ncbi:protein PAXX-like [Diadema setosum]|uniref:protein PAXX-like n=1 Tax=Diadema setosum TaxID=31175 RepID=UPI003B3B45A7
MSSGKSLAKEEGADCLHRVLEEGSDKYLCFTSCDRETWIIQVTNGIDVWRKLLDQANLESHRELADVTTYSAYFSRVSHAFKLGDLSVSLGSQGQKVVLKVGSGSTALTYDLYKATQDECKSDLQKALFHFAQMCGSLEKRLTAKEEELAAVKKQKTNVPDQGNLLPDFELKKDSGNRPKVIKQQGLSLVNPSSKKRKAAKGVEFD